SSDGCSSDLIRCTAADCKSPEKDWSRNKVRRSLRHNWNQSRQVIRLPVQLWKYSWAMTDCTHMMAASVVYSSSASTHEVLKIFRPLFSIAPILKALVATII